MPASVSIVIPCYNQAQFLPATLNSVLEQSHTNLECIIINDGSTDNTEIVVKDYTDKHPNIRHISTENKGLSAARNTGIRNSSGDFIQLLDADDLIEKNKLQSEIYYYESLKKDAKIIVYSSMRYFENSDPGILKILGRNNFIAHVELKSSDTIKSQRELITVRNPFVISAPLYPKTLFDNIGYFDESLTALEDWDIHLRCIESGYKFHHHYAENSNTLIRLHDSSMMRNQKLMDENYFKVLNKHQLHTFSEASHHNASYKDGLIKRIIKRLF